MTMLRTTTCSIAASPESLSNVEKKQTRVKKLIKNAAFWTAVAVCICLSAGNALATNVTIACHGTDSTTAINNAIATVSGSGGGMVIFTGGVCLSRSIHMMSNVTLQINAGVTIRGAGAMDAPEPNPFAQFQDFGHSHFHDALIWGERLNNIGFTGTGTIDGGGRLVRGTPGPGQGDKAISLRESNNVTITGITIINGGHFGILVNGINVGCSTCTMTVDHVHVMEANQRDGFNLINSQHVTVTNSDIEGSDDAMCLKSDFALGRKILNTDIHISNDLIRSTQNNATQFGSETCGDFTNVSFDNISITAAGKAGIGITTNDGAIIDGVTYNNIAMTGTTAPIWIKSGARGSCPNHPPAGTIRNVTISNVTATHAHGFHGSITSTISGLPGNPISNITLNNVNLTLPGGRPESDTTINPPETNNWTPSGQGPKPSYGWWMRHVENITINGGKVGFDTNDGRPAVIAVDGFANPAGGSTVKIGTPTGLFVFERGTTSIFDLGFDAVHGFCQHSETSTGLPPRIQNIGSTLVCP